MLRWNAPSFSPPSSIRAAATLEHWMLAAQLSAHHHKLHDELLGMAESGSDVVIRGQRYFFKMTAPQFREELKTERELLSHVANKLSVSTPEVVAFGELDGWPYLWMRKVEGTSLAKIFPALQRSEKMSIASQLGELVSELHRLPLFGDGSDWPSFLHHCVESAPTRHQKLGAPASLSEKVKDFLDRVQRPEAPIVLLHTEVLDEHVLASFDGERWKLCAMLDFADGRVGHPDYEFPAVAEFIFRGEEGSFEPFLRAYGWENPESYAERFLAWGLIHRFGSLPRMLRVAGEDTPNSLEELAARLYR
jgi:hygromycin-B 7''-O-kinase